MTTINHAAPVPLPVPEQRTRPVPQPPTDADRIETVLTQLRAHLDADRPTNIGFPSTFDLDYRPLWPFLDYVLNNVGDPYSTSAFPANTKLLEREVIDLFADLLRAPADDRWGYVTTGGTEGTEYGLLVARTLHPDAVLYYSNACHYSIPKLASKLRMPAVAIRTTDDGRMDLGDLFTALREHRQHPAVVLATIGTTMTEAIDDVTAIRHILADVPIPRAYIHADAALSGLPLALVPPDPRPGFDLADGADSISLSAHKFLGSPFPAGVVVTRRSLKDRISVAIDLLGTHDTTIGGSRSGHAPLIIWYALHHHGLDGLRERTRHARDLAQYTLDQLTAIGWPAWRHPHAMTVVLDTPPPSVLTRWALPPSRPQTHIVCLPGVHNGQIDALTAELAAARAEAAP